LYLSVRTVGVFWKPLGCRPCTAPIVKVDMTRCFLVCGGVGAVRIFLAFIP
jgi:hypothetical protein